MNLNAPSASVGTPMMRKTTDLELREDGFTPLMVQRADDLRLLSQNPFVRMMHDHYLDQIANLETSIKLYYMGTPIDLPAYFRNAVKNIIEPLFRNSENIVNELLAFGMTVMLLWMDTVDTNVQLKQQQKIQQKLDEIDAETVIKKGIRKFSRTINLSDTNQARVSILPIDRCIIYRRYNADDATWSFRVVKRPMIDEGSFVVSELGQDQQLYEYTNARVFYQYMDTQPGFVSVLSRARETLNAIGMLGATYSIMAAQMSTPAYQELSTAPQMQVEPFMPENAIQQQLDNESTVNVTRRVEAVQHANQIFERTCAMFDSGGFQNKDWMSVAAMEQSIANNPLTQSLIRNYPMRAPPWPNAANTRIERIPAPIPDGNLLNMRNARLDEFFAFYGMSRNVVHNLITTNNSSAGQRQNTDHFTMRLRQVIQPFLNEIFTDLYQMQLAQYISFVNGLVLKKGDRVPPASEIKVVITFVATGNPNLTIEDFAFFEEHQVLQRNQWKKALVSWAGMDPDNVLLSDSDSDEESSKPKKKQKKTENKTDAAASSSSSSSSSAATQEKEDTKQNVIQLVVSTGKKGK
jgi:hypothetical protein